MVSKENIRSRAIQTAAGGGEKREKERDETRGQRDEEWRGEEADGEAGRVTS